MLRTKHNLRPLCILEGLLSGPFQHLALERPRKDWKTGRCHGNLPIHPQQQFSDIYMVEPHLPWLMVDRYLDLAIAAEYWKISAICHSFVWSFLCTSLPFLSSLVIHFQPHHRSKLSTNKRLACEIVRQISNSFESFVFPSLGQGKAYITWKRSGKYQYTFLGVRLYDAT